MCLPISAAQRQDHWSDAVATPSLIRRLVRNCRGIAPRATRPDTIGANDGNLVRMQRRPVRGGSVVGRRAAVPNAGSRPKVKTLRSEMRGRPAGARPIHERPRPHAEASAIESALVHRLPHLNALISCGAGSGRHASGGANCMVLRRGPAIRPQNAYNAVPEHDKRANPQDTTRTLTSLCRRRNLLCHNCASNRRFSGWQALQVVHLIDF